MTKRAGIAPSGSLLARSYLNWGQEIDAPRTGAIAVFPRGTNPAQGHVGFVVGATDDALLILGGNQTDAVNVQSFPRDRALSFRWPDIEAVDNTDTTSNFERALLHVFDVEGGYTDDPHDPGGPTNLGITLATYATWRHIDVTPDTFAALKAELRALDRAIAASIYKARYWMPSFAQELPAALAFLHFDAAVNHGVGGAARMLQQACGVTIDGEIGPETLGAASTQPLPDLIARYADIRIARYRTLPHFWRFGRGWLNRVSKTRAAALDLISTSNPHPQSKDTSMTTTPYDPAPKWWGTSMTIWGTLLTAVTTVLPAIGPLFGIDITGQMISDIGHSLTALFQAIGGLVGTAMAIYGRSRAMQPLVRRPLSLKF